MIKKAINQGWADAYAKAACILLEADLTALCARCGAEKRDNTLLVRYFNTVYTIALPSLEFTPAALSKGQQILILHYLISGAETGAAQEKTRGEYLSFRKLPGGMFYDYAYRKNGPRRILAAFGNKPEMLLEAASLLGGCKADYGDVAAGIPVFPGFDAIVVLHRGDEEFPPEVNILFKDTITAYLPLEDIAVLAGYLAGNLQQALKNISIVGG